MVAPLLAAALLGSFAVGTGANLYSQYKQRELYRYQRAAYERQLESWHYNVPGRNIAYPELSYPGRIRALDTGISQSYASSLGSVSHLMGYTAGGVAYRSRSNRSLYSGYGGRSSRYL